MRARHAQVLVGAVAASAFLAEAALGQPSFLPLGDFPGGLFFSEALRVSDDGRVVVGDGNTEFGSEAFTWTPDRGMRGLGYLPGGGWNSVAFDVSADGKTVVGGSDIGNTFEAFVWRDGVMLGLGDISGGLFLSYAFGVTPDGSTIVGMGTGPSGPEAVAWTNGRIRSLVQPGQPLVPTGALGATPDGNVIVGMSIQSQDASEGFRWERSTVIGLGHFPGGPPRSDAIAVSHDGRVVVGSAWADVGVAIANFATRWTEATGLVSLGELPGGAYGSGASGISADGLVVVGAALSNLGQEGFIWDPVHKMRPLTHVLRDVYGVNMTGWKVYTCSDVSSDGTVIVGIAINPAGDREAYRAVIRPFCYANCDGSEAAGGIPTLTLADFGCFQAKYVLGDMLYADCTMDDRLSIADFGCFQNKYVLGCQ